MTIDLGTINAGLAAAGTRYPLNKVLPTMEAAGQFHSMWKIAGSPNRDGGVAGANPPAFTAGSGYVPTRATAGAIGQTNPTNNKYLALLDCKAPIAGTLILFDRLWACSGILSNSITAQNITTPGTLTAGRDPLSGLDVEPWIEYYTTDGATGGVWTLTGTDSSGTASRTWTATKPASAQNAGTIIPLLNGTAVGGCRVPFGMTLSISSGTAGDCGVSLLRRMGQVTVSAANVEVAKDALMLGLPEIPDDACLFFVWQCTTTTTMQICGNVGLPELTP